MLKYEELQLDEQDRWLKRRKLPTVQGLINLGQWWKVAGQPATRASYCSQTQAWRVWTLCEYPALEQLTFLVRPRLPVCC